MVGIADVKTMIRLVYNINVGLWWVASCGDSCSGRRHSRLVFLKDFPVLSERDRLNRCPAHTEDGDLASFA